MTAKKRSDVFAEMRQEMSQEDLVASISARARNDKRQINWAHWIAGQVGLVPYSEGDPGEAKTASHAIFARMVGRTFTELSLGDYEAEDIGGYPSPVTQKVDGKEVHFVRKLPIEPIALAQHSPSVLLVDEFGSVEERKQVAGLKLINDGIDGCFMFACGNPVNLAANGNELSCPMVNRVLFRQWEFDVEAHQEGSRNGLNFPNPSIPLVPPNWMAFHGKWGSLKADYIQSHPDALRAAPRTAEAQCRPWPSPRSWTNMERFLAAAESVGAKEDVLREGASGLIGESAANAFFNYVKELDLADPEDIIANPSAFELANRGDICRATLNSLTAALSKEWTKDRFLAVREFVEANYDRQPEFIQMWLGRYLQTIPGDQNSAERKWWRSELKNNPKAWANIYQDRAELIQV